MIKQGTHVITKGGLTYRIEEGKQGKRSTPWIGNAFAFLYDFSMKSAVFPKKFGADIDRHVAILREALKDVHGQRVLELATGSGSATQFLSPDNPYTGTDVSPGLLKQAVRAFKKAGFQEAAFYVTGADDLPFEENRFDLCLCVLALNFFGDGDAVFRELRRVLVPGGVVVCSVPIPERKPLQSTIRGTLRSAATLEALCGKYGFSFEPLPDENGALLYFRAKLQA